MDPKLQGDWVSRRQSMVYESLMTGGFLGPALLERRLFDERSLPHESPAAGRPSIWPGPMAWFLRLGQRWHRWRHCNRQAPTRDDLVGLVPIPAASPQDAA